MNTSAPELFTQFIKDYPRSYGSLADRGNIIQVRFRDKELNNKQVFRCIPDSEGWDLAKKEKDIKKASDQILATYFKSDRKVPKTPTQIIQSKTIREAIEEWLSEDLSYKDATKANHRYCLERFFKHSGIEVCKDFTQEVYREIAKDLRDSLAAKDSNVKPMTPRYYAMVRASAKEFLNYLVFKKYIPTNFIQNDDSLSKYEKKFVVLKSLKKGTYENKKVQIWPDKEYKAIRDYLNARDRTEIILLRYTGMDRADLGTLAHHHIKPKNVHHQIEKIREKKLPGSDPTIRLKLLGPAKDIILDAYKKTENETDLLFPWIEKTNNNSHSYLYDKVRFAWEKVYPKKKFKNLKALRHTFATWALTKKEYNGLEMPLEDVQDMLGHVKGSTVLRETYRHIEDAIGSFDPLD